jgi:hypothetical protein
MDPQHCMLQSNRRLHYFETFSVSKLVIKNNAYTIYMLT